MAAGTVITGGFPGRVAQEVFPNQKCEGCMHYDRQGGRTGVCLIGLRPTSCGDGDAQDIGYAPIHRGAGGYLPDMSNHGVRAGQVPPQPGSDLHGPGSTMPVRVRQVSLGEEHVHLVKSIVTRHADIQKSGCRTCLMRGSRGPSASIAGAVACTCQPIEATAVAKAVMSRMSDAARSSISVSDLAQWVRDVVKAGFRLPVPKKSASIGSRPPPGECDDEVRKPGASLSDQVRIDDSGGHLTPVEKAFYALSGRYDVSAVGGGRHRLEFHPRDGSAPVHLPGTFASRREARSAAMAHDRKVTSGSGRMTESTAAPTRQIRRVDSPARGSDDVSSGVPTPAIDKSKNVSKSLYSDDWVAQFRGTPLFAAARKLCEEELDIEEDRIERRKVDAKKLKAERKMIEKLNPAGSSDYMEEDIRCSEIRLKKQRLLLELADLVQQKMSDTKALDR